MARFSEYKHDQVDIGDSLSAYNGNNNTNVR